MSKNLLEEVYGVLEENLCAADRDYCGKNTILCPICLRPFSRDEVLSTSVEHILPSNVTKADPEGFAFLGTRNQRSGITWLCRSPRNLASDGRLGHDGCNGLKGSLYDRLFQGLMGPGTVDAAGFTHRHGVAILVMAYLAAFQLYGYEYILRPELDEVREQFDYPDERRTDWLDHALIFTGDAPSQIVATSSGLPFVTGGMMSPNAPLHVLFRRCQAYLPAGHFTSSGVRTLDLLLQ